MSSMKKSVAVAFAAFLVSASGAFAQAGGADVPSDAKAKGTMENGSSSTGMSKDDAMKKSGSMEKDGSMEKGGSMKKSDDKM